MRTTHFSLATVRSGRQSFSNGHFTTLKCGWGLKLNFHKSSMVFLGKSDVRSAITATIINNQVDEFSIKLLGLPLRPGTYRKADRKILIKRVLKKLDELNSGCSLKLHYTNVGT